MVLQAAASGRTCKRALVNALPIASLCAKLSLPEPAALASRQAAPPSKLPPAAVASPPMTSRRDTTADRWHPAGSHPPRTGSLRRRRAASPVRNLADLPRPAAPASSLTTPNKKPHPPAAAPPLPESRRHQPAAARPPQASLPAPLAQPPPPTAGPAPPSQRPPPATPRFRPASRRSQPPPRPP